MTAPRYDPSTFRSFMEIWRDTPVDQQKDFIAKLKALPKAEFFSSTYWGMIKGWIYATRKICDFCGQRHGLHIRRRTNEHRGEEFLFLEELQLLCENCRKHKHGFSSMKEIVERREEHWVA